MVLLGLVGVFALGLLFLLFGAGFFGGLFVLGSAGTAIYLGIKNPRMLKP